MRLSRRSRFLISAAVAFIVALGIFAIVPGLSLFAVPVGLGLGVATFGALTALVRRARRQRRLKRLE